MKKDLGLYLHIPFCVRKCAYCDFLSWSASKEEQEKYVQALQREIQSYQEFAEGYRVSTVFIGGGTPSVLKAEQIVRLLESVKKTFVLEKQPEITMEINPGTAEQSAFSVWRQAGINRLSIGLQAVSNENLKLLGRIHTLEEYQKTYEAARRAGFENISADLISSIPGQTLEAWKAELTEAVRLPLEHISVYQLIIEEGTAFYEQYEAHPEGLPDEEASREIYLWTGEFLREQGFEAYEISNYAKPGRYSRHNLKYWELEDYLGLGLGASSMLGNQRMSNTREMAVYLENCSYPQNMRIDVVFLEKPRQIEEFMFLGLRKTQGISKRKFKALFGRELAEVYEKTLKKYQKLGMLEEQGDRIYLTKEGILLSNYVLADFLLP